MPEPTIQTTFNIPPELHKRLSDQAREENRSMREVMEDALKLYFKMKERGA